MEGNVARGGQQCHHISLEDLVSFHRPASREILSDSQLDTLPERISYSPIHVPGLTRPLLRRDLFDARFQLYQRDANGHDDGAVDNQGRPRAGEGGATSTDVEGEEYVDSSTDLVPGLYEGGLKTWEGGVDLVEVLNGVADPEKWVRGARVLEVRFAST